MASSPPLASRTNAGHNSDKADDATEAARAALTPGAAGEVRLRLARAPCGLL
jgi:hypothetical protein